jgi:CheY-like chemotaxis protein
MAGQSIPQHKLQTANQPTPRDETKKIVNEILKRADQLIHKGDLINAQIEITKAKEADPRNVYVFALEERISMLKTDVVITNDTQQKSTSAVSPEHGNLPDTETSVHQIPPAPKPVIEETPPSPAESLLHNISEIKPQEKVEESMFDRSIELKSYRKALAEAWHDGALTESEGHYLKELRTLLDITDVDFTQIEKHVKFECYQNALLQQLSDSTTDGSNTTSVTDLQSRFQITDDEHSHILSQIMHTVQLKQLDKVLVIDDDTRLLTLLAASLEDNGFDVTALATSDEAYALLHKFIPDLILCDINLETSSMGGFTFYEKVQELKNIQSVPFVFLTGLTDESLVRAGKELGVDDYLMKPISEGTLVSTLRGKIKRFKQLNKIFAAPLPAKAAA